MSCEFYPGQRVVYDRRPLFTDGLFGGSGYSRERLRAGPDGPVFHAGRPIIIRPVWRDDFGALRIGRTGDMVQMIADLGVSDTAW